LTQFTADNQKRSSIAEQSSESSTTSDTTSECLWKPTLFTTVIGSSGPSVGSCAILTASSGPTDSLSFDELKVAACDLHVGRFLLAGHNSNITFVQLSECINPIVEISVVIAENMQLYVNVLGKPVMPEILELFHIELTH
jgi:hypothetical protein